MIDISFEFSGPNWDDLQKEIIKEAQKEIKRKLQPILNEVKEEKGKVKIVCKKDGSMNISFTEITDQMKEKISRAINDIS